MNTKESKLSLMDETAPTSSRKESPFQVNTRLQADRRKKRDRRQIIRFEADRRSQKDRRKEAADLWLENYLE
ncbi:hypothetical protein [Kangiella sp. TOML190]|uniref:hypothetical protein n=1 Tax=Kangiella sp. TOML190 TaxID=2931351 RepID=UPI00203AC3B0|nr:hypothetical protein [Kangiella sp. TOML190]